VKAALAAALAFSLAFQPATRAELSGRDLQYQVKAALLLNFAKFVEWPPPTTPYFIVGVIGFDPFNFSLDRVMDGKAVNGRPIMVRRLTQPGDATYCDLVFVSASERKRLPQILGAVAHRPVLTVSDLSGFTAGGGTIQFYEEEGRIRFEVNLEAAQRAGLRIQAQLLRLAKITDKRRAE
jgi:hypothetical protein